ncbi:hypothetical protein P153DRAFT_389040 [Dothidotthia symphoricarpi CBS 119687]|uniref:F-box domain-containing protein n=1 Tax=Dothidotthia symphoricarpi CBS 119687 TaxID=1392245 RepID=A0A6A6A6A8_9PLEO|nr:uncharacterized protein P153DRAFT_389040 [Dothidotthia symphoricarpi CBS 119687]KAF2126298.1 hypothetical protein P153DRAFT_389040 [Dothidotthia symphoricarpi CBS 119687]
MYLLTLPPELKLMIVDQLDPISSFKFAISCKSHWALCKPLMERAHSCAKYQTLSFDVYSGPEGQLLWHIAKEILDDPYRGEFVQDISLPSQRHHWDENAVSYPMQPQTNLRLPPIPYNEAFSESVQQITRVIPDPPGEISLRLCLEEAIAQGESDCPLVFLVHNAPNLNTLRVTGLEYGGLFYFYIRNTIKAFADPVWAPKLSLQHLTTVAMAHHDTEGHIPADWCRYIICIPSLRAFVASMIGGRCDRLAGDSEAFDEDEQYLWMDDDPAFQEEDDESADEERERPRPCLPMSNVEELMFSSSALDVKRGLERILCGVTALRRFYYDEGGALVDDEPYTPKRIINALVKHTGHSLENLVMEYAMVEDYVDMQFDFERVSLRRFKKLRTLRCDWKIVYPNNLTAEEKATFDLREILPSSLEALHLHGDFDDAEWEAIKKILVGTRESVPNLHNIYIQRGSRRSDNVAKSEAGEKVSSEWVHRLFTYLKGQGW